MKITAERRAEYLKRKTENIILRWENNEEKACLIFFMNEKLISNKREKLSFIDKTCGFMWELDDANLILIHSSHQRYKNICFFIRAFYTLVMVKKIFRVKNITYF